MSNSILIIGSPGTGKSTALRTLDPKETFVINVIDKPLPFRGYKKNYQQKKGGNYYTTDQSNTMLKILHGISETREDIKTIVIDDFQYVMSHEFMRRATEKGFGKFTEIGLHAWEVLSLTSKLRDDLTVVVICHSDTNEEGFSKIKTIGKLLDEKICLDGMFTIVLHSLIYDQQYQFLTQNDGQHLAKTPMDMFEEKLIPNDMQYVLNTMHTFYSDEDEEDDSKVLNYNPIVKD